MKLKKAWAAFLGAALMVSSININVMAAESAKAASTTEESTSAAKQENNGKILTLERAISGGINNDEKVAVLCKKITAYEDSLWASSGVLDTTYFSTKYSRDDAVQQKEFLRDTISYNVTILYQKIVLLQKEMAMNDRELELRNKELKQAQIKFDRGQASKLDLTNAQKTVDDLMAQQVQNQTTLKDYKSQFLNLTNINIDNYDGLEEDLKYEIFTYKNGVDALIEKNVSKYMENLEALIEYQKNHTLELSEAGGFKGTAPESHVVSSTEADVAEKAYNADQKRDKLKESLKTCYADLLNLQKAMETQQENIKYEETKLAATKIRYEKGYTSQIDLEEAEFKIEQLKYKYETDVYKYKQATMVLEKPWVKY